MHSAPSRRRKLSTSAQASKVAATIDRYLVEVVRLEADDGDDDATNATRIAISFTDLHSRWRRFAAAIGAVDQAMKQPLAAGAFVALLGARQLATRAHELLQLIATVGEAIACEGNGFRLDVLREFGVAIGPRATR
jgi:hypothetical protein